MGRGSSAEADAKRRFADIHRRLRKLGTEQRELDELASFTELKQASRPKRPAWRCLVKAVVFCASVAVLACLVFLAVGTVLPRNSRLERLHELASGLWMSVLLDADMDVEPCLWEMPETMQNLFRPPVDCIACRGVTEIPKRTNLPRDEFERFYAYTARPLVVTDGMSRWTAPDVFSFEFFKTVYQRESPVLEASLPDCQFFPYRTNFTDLKEVFAMSPERANLSDGSSPWYIGWSNCDSSAANVLRQHYNRPYFLPTVSESSKTDWIFMGSPGYGANMHIDDVEWPSWQAQVKGHKRWTLEPPPECYTECQTIQVDVHPGEIIVLDTNKWYHETLIIGDEMSITIGSEYD